MNFSIRLLLNLDYLSGEKFPYIFWCSRRFELCVKSAVVVGGVKIEKSKTYQATDISLLSLDFEVQIGFADLLKLRHKRSGLTTEANMYTSLERASSNTGSFRQVENIDFFKEYSDRRWICQSSYCRRITKPVSIFTAK